MILFTIFILLYLLYFSNSDQTIDTEDFWSHLVPKLASDLSTLCPINSIINTKEDGFLSYPYEIFGTSNWAIHKKIRIDDDDVYNNDDEINHNNTTTINNDLLYLCRGIDETMNGARDPSEYTSKPQSINHCLGSNGKENCPIIIEHLQSALSIIKWKLRPQICNVHDTLLKENEKVKIVVMGGSLPQGIISYGCCCKLDNKCPDSSKLDRNCPRERDDLNSMVCSWAYYFYRYLDKVFPSEIEFINLSRGGQTSVLTLLQFDELLGNVKLSKNDMILLDYSVNDEKAYGNRVDEIEFALEGIVRKFLMLGENAPAIFILEMYPIPPTRYTTPYRKVASHYKLPIISYYQAVYSDAMNTSSPNFKYKDINPKSIEYLMFDHGYGDHAHPPFFVHLWYAELIATSLLILSRHCVHMKTPKEFLHKSYISAIDLHDNDNSSHINDPLHPAMHGTYFCLANSHVDFHIDACQVMMNKINDSNHDVDTIMMINSQCHHINISENSIINDYNLHGFQLKIENKGKPGFIFETNSNISNISNDNMIDEGYLEVPLNGALLQGDAKIKISFLKTYENAGLFEVYACNTTLGIIDTLWREGDDKISITQTAVFLACDIHLKCANDNFPYVKIRHISGKDRIDTRLHQKVKIISISMCSRDQQCHHGISDSTNIV